MDGCRTVPDGQTATLESEIADLKRRLAELSDMRERERIAAMERDAKLRVFEAALETVPVGILLADETGYIYHGNTEMTEMVRHPIIHSDNADAYGEWIAFREDGGRVPSQEYPLARALAGEEDPELICHYQRGDGTRFWMRIIGKPFRDENEKIVGAAVACIDVSEQRKLQSDQQILIRELNHRVKNAFAVVKSIVSQSLRQEGVSDGLRQKIDNRLQAYARAHAQLVGKTWDFAPVSAIAAEILPDLCGDRIVAGGPDLEIPSEQGLALSMAFYELATNALKHGSLAVPEGRINLCWESIERDKRPYISLSWVERGGPPAVRPKKKGFGSFIIDRAMAARTAGDVTINYTPEGFEWRLVMPLDSLSEEQ